MLLYDMSKVLMFAAKHVIACLETYKQDVGRSSDNLLAFDEHLFRVPFHSCASPHLRLPMLYRRRIIHIECYECPAFIIL